MILRAFLLVLFAAAAAAAGVAQAQYRWQDGKGVTHFGNAPPPGARDVQKISIQSGAPDAPPVPFELARVQKEFPVTLYTAPGCKEGCERARALLNRRGVPFKEIQVWQEEANEELKRISGGTEVPTMVVGRTVEKGFEPTAFDAALDGVGYPKAGVLPVRTQKAPDTPEGYIAPDGSTAKPAQQAGKSEAPQKAGPYDPSGLTGPAPKPGQYDPSGLTGPPPKPGQYGVPGEASK